MFHDFSYPAVLATSARAAWQIEDVIGPDARLDFSRPFMPEGLARTAETPGLDAHQRLVLNQIRGHEYLGMFGLVEEFVLPFVLDHARPQLNGDDHRIRALLQFASEEAKHIHLFKRFHEAFNADFGSPCGLIGPAEKIAGTMLRHDPLGVALIILHIEWMTQTHYLADVRDNTELDPLFSSLLRHHWIEESQHAKLDTLIVEALAAERDAAGIDRAVDDYLAMGAYLDAGLKVQTELNLDALERATGRRLGATESDAFVKQQHQSARWTYLGSGMAHPTFRATLGAISPAALARIDAVAPAFA